MNYSPGGKSTAGGTSLLRRTSTRTAAAVAAGSLLLAGGGVAYADAIANKLDATVDSVAESMTVNLGSSRTTELYVVKLPDHGTNGCTIQGREAVSLNLVSTDVSVATVSPPTATFASCDDVITLTVTSRGVGTANIVALPGSNNTGEPYDVTPVNFSVTVAPAAPSNTAPVLTIADVTVGGSYTEGNVPQAMCEVSDAEDGPSSFLADLSAISGVDSAGGIGSQTASCSYKDAGDLTVASSVTYSITDGTAPEVSYTLSPATPDGSNGWYQSAVALDWTVTESDSKSTLRLTGCDDQTITEDQAAVDYSCSASSSGGSAGPVTVNLKKDGTAPTVGFTAATGTMGDNDWYTSDVEATFTGTDATSGLLTATQKVISSGEGAAVKVNSPAFTDIAGNTTAAGTDSRSFKIDKTAPGVAYTGASPAPNGNGWYNTDVVATFTGSDVISGLASTTKTVTSSGEGEAVEVFSPSFTDNAGNTTAAGADSATFKIDKTAPTVSFNSVIADSYFGSTAAAPSCSASDALSGLSGDCEVTGYSTKVGVHELKATAKDFAGNSTTVTQTYTVKAWTLKGFYQPVDMNNVLNTVKGGSTVPAQFEVFAGTTELTDPSLVSFSAANIQCTLQYIDDIELTTTGSTSLRYDATAGQFIYNWKTPTGAGNCYKLTMTAQDGSSISANFKLK